MEPGRNIPGGGGSPDAGEGADEGVRPVCRDCFAERPARFNPFITSRTRLVQMTDIGSVRRAIRDRRPTFPHPPGRGAGRIARSLAVPREPFLLRFRDEPDDDDVRNGSPTTVPPSLGR